MLLKLFGVTALLVAEWANEMYVGFMPLECICTRVWGIGLTLFVGALEVDRFLVLPQRSLPAAPLFTKVTLEMIVTQMDS